MSYSEIGLAFVGIVLLVIIAYVLLKPAAPGKDCPSDMVFDLNCGQCAPKNCSNIQCSVGKVATCVCGENQILCGGNCYPDKTIGCLNGNPYCLKNPSDKVCGTGSNTTCCQPNTTCSPDGTCGEGCKDPQICNNPQGNQCCTLPKQCLCVGGKENIGQCTGGDTNDNNTCCSPEYTIMSKNSVNGKNECCPYQAASCDKTTGVCTGINIDDGGKWLCCPGDFDPIRKKCAVACGTDGSKTFCDPDKQYCMAIKDTTGNIKYSCANNTCTWHSEMTYPQISNDVYAFTSDCMNPAVFVQNDTIDTTEGTGFSDRTKYVCKSTYNTLPDKARHYLNSGDPNNYKFNLRFFRAQSTMDNSGTTPTPLCNASDCHKKLSNYGDVKEMYTEKTGECWGSQTMDAFCGTNDSLIKLKNEVDPPLPCWDLTHVSGFLNSSNSTIPGICPFPLSPDSKSGGCTDFPANSSIF